MKSFTRIGLPILIVVGAVFGITFVRIYSPDDPSTAPRQSSNSGQTAKKREPLQFMITEAAPVPTPAPRGRESLTLWNPEIEVGVPGDFEFWTQNLNPEAVTVRVFDVNCQCAGVDLAVVPHDVRTDFQIASILAASPLCPDAGRIGAAIAHATFDRRLSWAPLLERDGGEKPDRTIPGADSATGPQTAIVRLNWKPKMDAGPKEVFTRIAADLGDGKASHYKLTADTFSVPAFSAVRRIGPAAWELAPEVQVGELRAGGEARRSIYLLSATRRYPTYSVRADKSNPCLSWSDPVPASPEEFQSLADYFSQPGHPPRRPLSLFRVDVTVRERADTNEGGKPVSHQLDLGLLDMRFTVAAANGGSETLAVRGRVLGDVTFLAGAADGRIDLGNSIPANQDLTRDVLLVAEKSGIELTHSAAETRPSYLKVRIEPMNPIDGRSQWRLRVTIPKGSLVGPLPADSAVVLTTGGPNPRRLRIPIRGMTYDTGEPRF
jgi:hypothetical protein